MFALSQPASPRTAFSLVELSIVLVILGLLVGGILSGQALIRAAELRSVTADYARYHAAMYTFRDKYFGLPGDITNATSFWGDQATGTESCASAATPDGTPGTCNGNGDGLINIGPEAHRGWQQLAMAGLIEGQYTGYNGGGTGCGSLCDSIAGVNVPRARIANGGFSLMRTGQSPVDDAANFFSTVLGGSFNMIVIGSKTTNFYYFRPLMRPEEVWNIDTKLDDGLPQSGRIYPSRNIGCTTTNDPATANYALSVTTSACNLLYKY